ncbi:MAG: ATP-binding protein [Planctomycetaceae bacterium]|nr:ATP-binding protein [Planctomycetaceae bacterium]
MPFRRNCLVFCPYLTDGGHAAVELESLSWTWTRECTFPSDMGTAHNLIEEVVGKVRSDQWNDKDIFALELSLEETLMNAVKHGNKSDPSKTVRFECKLNEDMVYVRVEDEGEGFDPHSLADPREPDNQTVVSGRGVLLIQHFATKVEWNDRGNVIEFVKERS